MYILFEYIIVNENTKLNNERIMTQAFICITRLKCEFFKRYCFFKRTLVFQKVYTSCIDTLFNLKQKASFINLKLLGSFSKCVIYV